MRDIKGEVVTVEQLFTGDSYSIDYYQREYNWRDEHLQSLIEDLAENFMADYKPGHAPSEGVNYGHYFLGSIVISQRGNARSIVDGQQRLTSLTLLLIYLHKLQEGSEEEIRELPNLIYANDRGQKRFKLNIPEREDCMKSLLRDGSYNVSGEVPASIQNMKDRYEEIEGLLPAPIKDEALISFIFWLLRNVKLIRIITEDDRDAYTIFETVNDRGLSLTPAEMLKGYLLSQISDESKRARANNKLKRIIDPLNEKGKGVVADFYKAWFRGQYADKDRRTRAGETPSDYDEIGTTYHRWFWKNHPTKVENSSNKYEFINQELAYYGELYKFLLDASTGERKENLDSVRYNADLGFTIQYQVLLAPVKPGDSDKVQLQKIKAVADYLDIWLNLLAWNGKRFAPNFTKHHISDISNAIRRETLANVRKILKGRLKREKLNFSNPTGYHRNAKIIRCQLARLADWLEAESHGMGRYENYVSRKKMAGQKSNDPFEIEHLWANDYDKFKGQFSQLSEFEYYRNLIGGLVLLPKSLNASLQDASYEDKLKHYSSKGDNVLARSLHPDFYGNNPRFKRAIDKHGLKPGPYEEFGKKELLARCDFYCKMAELVWSPKRID